MPGPEDLPKGSEYSTLQHAWQNLSCACIHKMSDTSVKTKRASRARGSGGVRGLPRLALVLASAGRRLMEVPVGS